MEGFNVQETKVRPMRIKSCLFKFNEFRFHCCCILFGQSDGLLSAGPAFQRALLACSSGVPSPSTTFTGKNVTVGDGERNSALKKLFTGLLVIACLNFIWLLFVTWETVEQQNPAEHSPNSLIKRRSALRITAFQAQYQGPTTGASWPLVE